METHSWWSWSLLEAFLWPTSRDKPNHHVSLSLQQKWTVSAVSGCILQLGYAGAKTDHGFKNPEDHNKADEADADRFLTIFDYWQCLTLFRALVTARMDIQPWFLLGFCWGLQWWLHLCTCSAGAGANSEGLLNLSIEVRVTSEVSVQKLLCHICYVNFSSNACTAVWSPTERKYWQVILKVTRAIHHSGGLLPDIKLDQ